ncbi:competence protein TfoX [Rhizobium rhizosphaerae]|uniref:Competence protein TfoX n=1 Tax=Xaviernesmea rhizosphaerae TaxID=1672749 RepID=A0A1Q9AG12_9HYPH|nr:TfoX/Sxy family protein [Xaviernesmea rhizosphaerae]OLP53895.1 competence protein TfoX [Xaviernesmea rhizosphaerae]OQP88097.1 competence protein TfoX [Xaviernesmea rhizosphaerae]
MDDEAIREIFDSLGPVSIRRMFGGKGIYADGRILAILLHDTLMLKGDGESAPRLEAAGAERWSYEGKGGKTVLMPYWTVPPAAYDDPDEMAVWVREAFDAALRAVDKATPVRPARQRGRSPAG